MPYHQAAVETAVVDLVRIPFAEAVVRPLVGRVVVIVGARVERQFLQPVQVEVRVLVERPGSRPQILHRHRYQGRAASRRHAGAAQVQGDGAEFFVGIRLTARPAFQDRDGTVPDVVVELLQRAVHDPVALVPRALLGQHRLQGADGEARLKQLRIRLVEQQIGMMLAVGSRQFGESQCEDRAGLLHILERRVAGPVQGVEGGDQLGVQRAPGILRAGHGGPRGKSLGLHARIGPPGGEIEVAEQRLQRRRG